MDDSPEIPKKLKWGVGLILTGVIAYFALPIIVSMVLNLVTIAICGVLLFALWMFLPAISESLAQLSYRSWEMAIRSDPIARVKRDLETHSKDISEVEKRIAQASAGVNQLKALLRTERNNLSPEDVQESQSEIAYLEKACVELVRMRDAMLADHREFERIVANAEAKMRIGNAFSSVAKAFVFDKKSGKDSAGARVALDEVQKRLSTSKANLQVILSRPIVPPKGQAMLLDSSSSESVPLLIPSTEKVRA